MATSYFTFVDAAEQLEELCKEVELIKQEIHAAIDAIPDETSQVEMWEFVQAEAAFLNDAYGTPIIPHGWRAILAAVRDTPRAFR